MFFFIFCTKPQLKMLAFLVEEQTQHVKEKCLLLPFYSNFFHPYFLSIFISCFLIHPNKIYFNRKSCFLIFFIPFIIPQLFCSLSYFILYLILFFILFYFLSYSLFCFIFHLVLFFILFYSLFCFILYLTLLLLHLLIHITYYIFLLNNVYNNLD